MIEYKILFINISNIYKTVDINVDWDLHKFYH